MNASDQEHLQVTMHDEIAVVDFINTEFAFEEDVVRAVGDELYRLVDDHKLTRLLLNFRNVRYISTAMLGRLIGLNKKIERAKGQLKLCGLGPVLKDIFHISRLDRVFDLFEDVPGALAKF
jgi:anti-sigma B factor antagonist